MDKLGKRDYIIDRFKLKKQLNRWRILAVLVLLVFLFDLVYKGNKDFFEYIGRINIDGMITHDQSMLNKLDSIGENDKIKALIVHVNSPGGTFVGSEALYNHLKKIGKVKPVIVIIDDIAASGGYMTAMGGNYIIAHQGSLTGSIGVLSINYEITDLAKKLGVHINLFKSSPFKAAPNPFEKTTPEVEKEVEQRVLKSKDIFLSMVLKEREISKSKIDIVGSGKVFVSQEALELGLIDAIGNEETAKEWLVKNKELDNKLKVKQVDISNNVDNLKMLTASISSLLLSLKSVLHNVGMLF